MRRHDGFGRSRADVRFFPRDPTARTALEGYLDALPADAAGLLASAGIEARPANRLWLLRVPPRFPHLDEVFDDLMVEADKGGVEPGCNAAFVDLVAARIHRLFND